MPKRKEPTKTRPKTKSDPEAGMPSLRFFEVVALGCNRRAETEIRKIFHKHNIETFMFVEYFLTRPIDNTERPDDANVFFPFLWRLAHTRQFIPWQPKDAKEGGVLALRPRAGTVVEDIRQHVYCPVPALRLPVAPELIKRWKSIQDVASRDCGKTIGDLKRIWEKLENDRADDGEVQRISFNFLIRPWLACSNNDIDTLPILACPIASKDVFYGYLLVIYPMISAGMVDPSLKLRDEMEKLAEKVYRPTLILFHNSAWEKEMYGSDITTIPQLREEIKRKPAVNWSSHSDPWEQSLGGLWSKRLTMAERMAKARRGGPARAIAAVKKTLLFRKYNIASPGMIEVVSKLTRGARRIRVPKVGDALPAALVFGEQGSGKDTLANLIPLFTDLPEKGGYFGSDRQIMNMSAMKPNAIVAPVLLGVAKQLDKRLKGVLASLKPSVFVLDELNSMDQDLQGILLRVLENGEVMPLFERKPVFVQHLLVGIVNEDPMVVTREQELRELTASERLVGRMFGAFLYEALHKARRLRPDLVYRFSRFLNLRLPSLRERNEDISILFYVNCRQELEELLRSQYDNKVNCEIDVEADAFELLMRRDLTWPGNVRQLEAVAKEVASLTYEDYIKKNKSVPDKKVVPVSYEVVFKVLEGHYEFLAAADARWQ